MRRIAILFVGLAVCSTPASAGYLSGNELLRACSEATGFALGYIVGTIETIQISQENGMVKPYICLREGTTNGQMADIACKYLKDEPSVRDFNAVTLVSHAMSKAFPC